MEEEISLNELFFMLKRNLNKIILGSLIGVVVASVYTFFIVTPQYESSSKIVVNQTQNLGNPITNNDIQTNLNLINTYQSIIREPIILEDVIDTMDSNLTLGQLREKIGIQTQNDSLVFGISVIDENPYIAAELANAVADSFQSKIGDILEVESVTILSEAVPNINQISPNSLVNVLLGLIIGTIVGGGYSILIEYMDNTIKGSDFISKNIGWTDLGAISLMTEKELKDMAVRHEEQKIETRRGRRVV